MFGSSALETVIGLIGLYALLSVICSAARETLEAVTKSRATFLERGIRDMLGEDLAARLYRHPMIAGLSAGKTTSDDAGGDEPKGRRAEIRHARRMPSYIPSHTFGLALFDVATAGETGAGRPADAFLSLGDARERAGGGGDGDGDGDGGRRAVVTAIDAARFDPDRAIAELEAWFDAAMDRVSGRYRRRTQGIVVAIATVLVVALNVDSVAVARHLYGNPAEREAMVSYIERTGEAAAVDSLIVASRLPLGWSAVVSDQTTAAGKVGAVLGTGARSLPGWLITILALTMGAPFWFDLLNKMMVIRSTVKPREKSPAEGSEDRRRAASGRRPARPWQPLPPARGAVPAAADGPSPEIEDDEPGELQAGYRASRDLRLVILENVRCAD